MARYKMEDGTVVDTANASQCWEAKMWWNGSNHVSTATGDQFSNEYLHRSRRGRYYIEHTSQRQGVASWAEWVSPERAAAWLVLADKEVPEELKEAADKICE